MLGKLRISKIWLALVAVLLLVCGGGYVWSQIAVSENPSGGGPFVTLVRLGLGANASSNTILNGMVSAVVSVDPASISTVSTGATNVTVSGVATGDACICNVPSGGLNDDLVFKGCQVTAANTLTLYIYNPTNGSIDDGAANWTYLCFDR